MAGRGGINNQLMLEMVEILYGKRGPERQWALRRGELQDVQKIIADVKKSLEDLKKALAQVKDDVDELNLKVNQIEQRLNVAEQAINELEEDLSELEQRINTAEGALTQIETTIQQINLQLGSIGSDTAQLRNDLNALGQTVSLLSTAVSTLQNGAPDLSVTSNLNDAVTNKAFQWSNTSTNTPVSGSYGRGLTIANSANDLTQLGIINATGQLFVRYRTGGTWGVWSDIVSLRAEPYALQSNPGATPFPANVFTALPFYTNGEIAAGITITSNKTFTVAQAGLYQFELEVRINGGATNMPPVGTAFALSIDTTTVPTAPRAGYSVSDTVRAMTITRLVCTERLAAGAQRVAYILNQGAAAYQVVSAVIKITRLSA